MKFLGWLNDQRDPNLIQWFVQTSFKFVIFAVFMYVLGLIIL